MRAKECRNKSRIAREVTDRLMREGRFSDKIENRVEAVFKASGYMCVVKMTEHGARCGYVGVPLDHPAKGAGEGHDILSGIIVHGGITFSDIKLQGVSAKRWWFGFDCMHSGDAFDPRAWNGLALGDHFWSHEEVKEECRSLAAQLKTLEKEMRT